MIIGKAISPFRIKRRNGIVPTDADAQAFITASGISGTNATATNQLVINLKAANIWTKIKAAYPFVGNTANSQKYNLKDARDLDAAYRLIFIGGGTFSNNGYSPGGVNGYADTFLTPSTLLGLNNAHLSMYTRISNQNSFINSTFIDALNTRQDAMCIVHTAVDYGSRFNDDTSLSAATTNTQGFVIGSRISSTVKKYYKNNLTPFSATATSTVLPNRKVFIGSILGNGYQVYSSNQIAFSSIGDGLTDAEALAFYNAVQTFNTTLGRQV